MSMASEKVDAVYVSTRISIRYIRCMHPGNALKFKGIGQVHEVYFSWRGVLLDVIEVLPFSYIRTG